MSFKFKTPPRKHQQREFDRFRDEPRRALLWQMRSGKSKAVIDLAGYLWHSAKITGVVIFAPNVVHSNWVKQELPKHCAAPYRALAFSSASANTASGQIQFKAVCQKNPRHLSVFSINSESIRTEKGKAALTAFLKSHGKNVLLIVDECHEYRTPSSKRGRVGRAFAKECAYVRILTGTAVMNSPLHAWGQFELLEHGALGFKRYGDFENRYAIQKIMGGGGRQFVKVVGYQNLEELRERIGRWSSVVLREDCDVPPLNQVSRSFDMTPKQKKLYTKLEQEHDLHGDYLEGGVRRTKLQQIASGWYYDDTGATVDVVEDGDNPRLQLLKSEIEGDDRKVIVWCRFDADIQKVKKLFDKLELQAVIYDGSTKPEERWAAVKAFQSNRNVRGFIGQPQSGGVGLDLSEAEVVIWYSHTDNLIIRQQASERATAVGGRNIDLVDFSARRSVDEVILTAHQAGIQVSDMLAGAGLKAWHEDQEWNIL